MNMNSNKTVTANFTTWSIKIIDSDGYVGSGSSIDTDSSGNVHISYYDSTNGDLKYATNASGSWVIQVIDSGGDVGTYTSISIDSLDRVHISYYDATNDALKYVGPNGSGIVDSYGGIFTSIAIDSLNRPHISYVSGGYGSPSPHLRVEVRHAYYDGISWISEIVDSAWGESCGGQAVEGFASSAIAIDSLDRSHISYYGWACNPTCLYHAYYNGTSWSTTEVDYTGHWSPYEFGGRFTSVAIDSANNLHISYYGNGLKYTYYDGTTWQTETVDNDGGVGEYSSLAVDSSDKAHISYYDSINADLKYAINAPPDSDGDGIYDDGDGSGVIGDNHCTGGNTTNCDDNCVDTPNPNQADADSDGVGDACDNCRLVANPDQRDTNSGVDDNTSLAGEQHYGNLCDPDFDNNGLVGLEDFNTWRTYYRQTVPPAPADVDLNGNGVIDLGDYNIWRSYYRKAPGPGIGD